MNEPLVPKLYLGTRIKRWIFSDFRRLCGLLHTFSSEALLISERKARRICYAWGEANVQDLQRTFDLVNKSKGLVAVNLNDLYEGWRLGVSHFTEELEKDYERKLRVYEKAAKFFSELGLETVSKIITMLDKSEGSEVGS